MAAIQAAKLLAGGGNSDEITSNGSYVRDEDGFVTLPNGQRVNGFGSATRNSDGGVTFRQKNADGSSSFKSYDKEGNAHTGTYDKSGKMTSDCYFNKDGSSKGFIQKDDGTTDKWDEPPGKHKYEDFIF